MSVIASVVDLDLGATFQITALCTVSTGLCGMCGIARNNKSCFPLPKRSTSYQMISGHCESRRSNFLASDRYLFLPAKENQDECVQYRAEEVRRCCFTAFTASLSKGNTLSSITLPEPMRRLCLHITCVFTERKIINI